MGQMREELREKLFNDFPGLFRRGGARAGGCWEIAIGDGWFDLVYNLSKDIQLLVDSLPEDKRDQFSVVQVKEKMASLRFYMNGATKKMYALIREAEAKAYSTCDVCGNEGWIQGEGWDERVRCTEHGPGSPMERMLEGVERATESESFDGEEEER